MKIEYRRKLPHKFYLGYTFFITWNLKGAIPAQVIAQMKQERDDALKHIESAKNLGPEEKLSEIHQGAVCKTKFFDRIILVILPIEKQATP